MHVDDGERRTYPLAADHEAPLGAATGPRRAAVPARAAAHNAAVVVRRGRVAQCQAMGGIRVQDPTRHPPDRRHGDRAE